MPARRTPLPDRQTDSAAFSAEPVASAPHEFLRHVLLPLGGSVTLHAALIGLLMFTTWSVITPRHDGPQYDVGIVGSASGQAGFDWDAQSSIDPAAGSNTRGTAALNAGGTADAALAGLAGAATGDRTGGGMGSDTSGLGGLLGIGGGADTGGSTDLGAGIGGQAGPGAAGVWSLSARGHRFAYVVDFSGSIIVAVDPLRRELKRSIGKLGSDQWFNVVVFYSVDTPYREQFRTESFRPSLQPATTINKRDFFEWIDQKQPRGSTRPLPAIKRALAMRPEAIFFFSDGQFDDEVVTAIRRANTARTRIHCLVFDEILLGDTSGLPRLTDGAKRLARIAAENGGKSKVVTGLDLE